MSVRTVIRSSVLLLACMVPRRATAQGTTSLLPNATTLPSRSWRMRLLTSWTRWDALYTDSSSTPRNIAAGFASDSLGTADLPILAPAQDAIRTLSGNPDFRLTAGQLVAAANSRVVTAPLILEYGLTSRITLGVVVPLVETRTTLHAQLNPHTGLANVGPNPAALGNSAAAAQNAALVQSISSAANALQQKFDACQQSASGPNCAQILADGPTLKQRATTFASVISSLYGTTAGSGAAFIPLAKTALDTAIMLQIRTLSDQFNGLGVATINGAPADANGPAANAQLNALLEQFGIDTLQSTDRSSIGDISVGATLELLNTFPDSAPATSGGVNVRLAVNGAYRIGTGEPASRARLFDVSTGYGQPGVIAGAAADVRFGSRVTTSVIGSYTAQLGTVNVGRVPNANNAIFPLEAAAPGTYSAGNVLRLTVVPHYRLAGFLSLDGVYSLLNVGADKFTAILPPVNTGVGDNAAPTGPIAPYGLPSTTAQQFGFGFSYSSLVSPDRAPGRLPFEVTFQHLETMAGSGGPVPKTFRDQLELRIYYRR